MTLGQQIQAARKAAGWTQAKLANECGWATITIQQYERDKREPRIEQLKAIADALGINLFDLIPEERKKGFEHIPSYFLSNKSEERDKAHQIEETLMNNAIKISQFDKLVQISQIADKAIEGPLTELDEEILRTVLLDSFDSLNLRGKYEAVERVSDLELFPRFSKNPKK